MPGASQDPPVEVAVEAAVTVETTEAAEVTIDMKVVGEEVVDTTLHLVMIAVVSTTMRVVPSASMVLQFAPSIESSSRTSQLE